MLYSLNVGIEEGKFFLKLAHVMGGTGTVVEREKNFLEATLCICSRD